MDDSTNPSSAEPPPEGVDESRWRTALHESGHCAVAFYYRLRIHSVTIDRDRIDKNGAGGVARITFHSRPSRVLESLASLMGGLAADVVFDRAPDDEMLRLAADSGDIVQTMIRHLDSDRVLGSNLDIIELKRLLDRHTGCDGEKRIELIRMLVFWAVKCIRENRAAVRALAHKLALKGTMSGDAVRQTLKPLMGRFNDRPADEG
ncbi:MAG: hypothetical protein AB7O62_22670 [Pirellulales bacterium]